MKKTLFLSAILGAALCSSAFAEHNYSWTTSGSTITPADNGTAITYGSVISVNTATTDPITGDVKVKSTGDNMAVDLSKADSIYISEGRVQLNDAAKLGDAAVFVKGGTLWVRCAEVSNDLYIGASTYSKDNENCNLSALRLQKANSTITLSGTITLGENARINATQNTTVNITGNINGAGKALSLTVYYGNPSRFNLSGTNTLGTLDIAETLIGNGPQRADVTISGGTTTTDRLTLGLASDATLTVANGATLTVNNGASLAKTITNNGTLNLKGNITLSGMAPVAFSGSFGDTQETATQNGNGFSFGDLTKTYKLINGSGTLNSTATFADATASGGSCDAAGNVVLVDSSAAYDNHYFVNNGTVQYSDDAAIARATQIHSAAGTSISIAAGSTLNASKLTAEGATELSGNGLYVAGSAQTLGTNVSLADTWTGTVQLTGDLNAQNIHKTAANGTSILEMKGVTGWFYDWYDVRGSVGTNIKLTDNGQTLAWVNGAFGGHSDKPVSTFTGTWSGTGSFRTEISNDREMNYTYSGNIADWTGKFIYGGKGNLSSSILTFKDNATAVNIAIEKGQGSAGTFTVVADTNVTFSKDITANTLTINDNKTVDLGTGTLTLSTMTLGNGSTVNFHSTKDWTKSEVARTTGNGYGHFDLSTTLGYAVTDNGATVTVDGLAATLNDSKLSCTTTEETDTYYVNSTTATITITKDTTLVSNLGDSVYTDYIALADGKKLTITDDQTLKMGGEANKGVWMEAGSSVVVSNGATLENFGLSFTDATITNTSKDTGAQIGIHDGGGDTTEKNRHLLTVSGNVTVGKDVTRLRDYTFANANVTVDSGMTTDINSALSDTTDLTVNSGSTANFTKTDSSVKTLAGEGSVTVGEGAGLTVHGDSSVNTLGGLGTVTALADLTVTGGNVTLGGLEIAGGKTVTIGSKGSHNHTLALQSLTVNSAAESPTTLNANLDLTKTTTLTLNGALTLGCELNLGNGGITLGGTLLEQALELTEVGDSVTLFNSVDSVTGYKSPWEASTIFSNDALKATDTKNYLVVFDSTAQTVNLTLVPEPATATLSLLALAALAARRRRK